MGRKVWWDTEMAVVVQAVNVVAVIVTVAVEVLLHCHCALEVERVCRM